MSRQGALEDEHGFSLVELTIVIIIMGLVFAIASSAWLGAIESRKVDTATNQVAADLRHAHSKATNRLENWQVIFAGDSTYTIGPTGSPIDEDLDDDPTSDPVIVGPAATITFKPDGSATLPGASPLTLTVSSADGGPCDPSHEPCHQIKIYTATSGIEIVP
jgi:prepilin-type N-terminal cleavage/methylation domain-containing protein